MRAAPSLFLVIALFAFASNTSAQPVPGGGVNLLDFVKGSPAPIVGGVDVAVTQKATVGYTCTKMVIRVIDDVSGATLDSHTVNNPPAMVTKSFTGIGNNLRVQVTVEATFASGELAEVKRIDAVVTTK